MKLEEKIKILKENNFIEILTEPIDFNENKPSKTCIKCGRKFNKRYGSQTTCMHCHINVIYLNKPYEIKDHIERLINKIYNVYLNFQDMVKNNKHICDVDDCNNKVAYLTKGIDYSKRFCEDHMKYINVGCSGENCFNGGKLIIKSFKYKGHNHKYLCGSCSSKINQKTMNTTEVRKRAGAKAGKTKRELGQYDLNYLKTTILSKEAIDKRTKTKRELGQFEPEYLAKTINSPEARAKSRETRLKNGYFEKEYLETTILSEKSKLKNYSSPKRSKTSKNKVIEKFKITYGLSEIEDIINFIKTEKSNIKEKNT